MATIPLACRCGDMAGSAADITPTSGNRIVCCCTDCQAFAAWLGPDAGALDAFGGTDIYQAPASSIAIDRGQDRLRSMRLSEKGLIRWYAGCCNTPIGNTVNARLPFVGLIHTFIDLDDRDAVPGPSGWPCRSDTPRVFPTVRSGRPGFRSGSPPASR